MKTRQTIRILVAAIIISGCTAIAPGNDPVVVDAQRLIPSASDTIDAFLKTEYQNHAAIKAQTPQIANYANYVRAHVKQWRTSAWAMLDTYSHNRTPQNKANLQTALAVLSQAISQIQSYQAQLP